MIVRILRTTVLSRIRQRIRNFMSDKQDCPALENAARLVRCSFRFNETHATIEWLISEGQTEARNSREGIVQKIGQPRCYFRARPDK